jgi:hypothetical protein
VSGTSGKAYGRESGQRAVLFEAESLQDARSKERVCQEENAIQEGDYDGHNNLDITSDELMDLEELGKLARDAVDQFQALSGSEGAAVSDQT